MQDVPARRGASGALSATHRAGTEAAAELIARFASALGQLVAWLDGRRLDDASLAAYLGYLHQAGRAPATAALAVAAVRRGARDAGEEPPAGPLTRQALEGFPRSAAADAPARRGQARGLTAEECAAVLATCGRPRRTGRGLEGRTSHGGRVGLAVELTARGAATHAVQLAGGWKDASMVVRYAAAVATRDAVSRYMR